VSKRRLLLADDSVTIQKVVNLTFAEEGIEVITAGDGNSAMEKFVEFPPDLVMVDVNMPGFDGYKICEMIKQDEETRQIPVILLVGSFEPFDETEARRVGADDYLTKPFQSIRQLVSRVSDLLNRPNGEGSSANQNNFSSENLATDAFISDLGITSQATNGTNFGTFDDTLIDDEMIQTNQIGSLPVDESQKFVSEPIHQTEPNLQTSENDFANWGKELKEEVSLETKPLTSEYFQQIPEKSAEDEIFRLDEKVFDFDDDQSLAKTTEPVVSEQKTVEIAQDEKFPEYSTMADNNKYTANETDFNVTAQPQNASIFDFDDLDLLELPPPTKKPTSEVEQEILTESIAENSLTETFDREEVSPKEVSPTSSEVKAMPEIAEFSPEIIEAITKKIMEKLSDKVIREIAQELTPQAVESAMKEMAQKKTN
jgi:CheY-like chemotaxis protein